jgi:hypothetical protein
MCLTGCKKLVDIDPPTNRISSENVYTTDATAISVMTGVYTKMSNNSFAFVTGANSVSILTALSSDELILAGGSNNSNKTFFNFFSNQVTNLESEPWQGLYACLYTVNTALEHLSNSTFLTPAIQRQLIGEAKFIRAFCYFYLINLYGDVPMVLTSDYRVNTNASRSAQSSIYQQIISDLKDAQQLLSETYLDVSLLNPSQERVRPSKWAATALLARVYLFTEDWVNAEVQASIMIDNSSIFLLSTLDESFLKASMGNKEAIWQLQPVNSGLNTEDAQLFILAGIPGNTYPIFLDTLLVKSFEAGDARRSNWVKDTIFSNSIINYSYAYKYKIPSGNFPVNEYLMVLRFAEQYLIRAEARTQQNNLLGAITDLDKIRQRASLPLLSVTNPSITKESLLNTILHERQVELFTEWGHRWLDLKRTSNVDAVMSIVTPLKGGTWNPNWALYPIPTTDLKYNPNISQNPGY